MQIMLKWYKVIEMMESSLQNLNAPQREAATTIDEHVRIIAGAGSGKTRVLMARIAYLVNEVGILPWRIMAITFTNKAANEMKERLSKELGEDAQKVKISTIHALCVRILREDAHLIGYPKSFTIMDRDDQKTVIKKLYKIKHIKNDEIPANSLIAYISNNKSADVPVEMAQRLAQGKEQKQYAQLYEAYEKERKEMRAMDFDDLLIEANRLLKTMPEVAKKWKERLDYIHVDEFQDVDPIQYSIIKQICSEDARLCVVGDPDQTIYTWRGASIEIILRFDQDFKPCKTIILNENYRSTKPILEASNALIANNKDRIKKDLFTNAPGEEPIERYEALEESQEPIYIAKKIVEDHKKGTPYHQFAILYRSNYLSRSFEKTFRSVGIPYRIFGGIRFYERQEIKDMLSYLHLCAHSEEMDPKQLALDLSLKRVINMPKRGIGATTLEKLEDEAILKGENMYEALQAVPSVSKATQTKLNKFHALIESFKEARESMDLLDFFDFVFEKSGYKEMLEEKEEDERIENVLELKEDIHQAMETDQDLTLETYLQNVALFTEKSQDEQEDAVNLMTVHAAKGLEFSTVFVTNLNEGIFPNERAINENGRAGLEEERRLMYVAMTRAKKHLFLSWNNGYSFMLEGPKTPSRFLKELPNSEEDEQEETLSNEASFKMHKKPVKYRAGDLVSHSVYGEGVLIEINGTIGTIAFSKKYGLKKIDLRHASLQKG